MATFTGTTGADHFTGGSRNDTFKMTADDGVTDLIDGGFGNDTVDYSSSDFTTGVPVNITLTDPTSTNGASGGTVTADFIETYYFHGMPFSFTHTQTVAQLTSIENATGSNFDDTLNGNSGDNVLDGGFGHDVINGGAGNDTIIGGGDYDVLTGGAGSDTFVFNGHLVPKHNVDGSISLGEAFDTSASIFTADVITDFEQGIDHIDLRGIDADINTTGDQAFNFIGTSQFTGHAGELCEHLAAIYLNTYVVQGDVDGDGQADFSILVQGSILKSASDFLL